MIIPARNFLLVKPHEAEEKTQGGLYIPQEQMKKPSKGVIKFVGVGCEDINTKQGHEVAYSKGAGIPIDEETLLIREDDILYYEVPESQ